MMMATYTLNRLKYMTEEQVKKLRRSTKDWAELDKARGRRQGVVSWMLVDLVLQCGFRVTEISNLKVGDINFKDKWIRVFRLKKKKRLEDFLNLEDPNFIRHLADFIAWKKTVDEPTGPDDPLLVRAYRKKTGPLSAGALQMMWKVAADRAGVGKLQHIKTEKGHTVKWEGPGIHCGRHTFGINDYRENRDLRATSKRMGHSTIQMTLAYVDIVEEELRKCSKNLGNYYAKMDEDE